MTGVKATRVDDIDEANTPGAFEFFEGTKGDGVIHGLVYLCPCGCGHTGVLDFRLPSASRPSWEWDGNLEAPTLTPSVNHVGHWHGYLRNGVWERC
jgi:hypothetical protein